MWGAKEYRGQGWLQGWLQGLQDVQMVCMVVHQSFTTQAVRRIGG